jgi:galactose oxidase-like protein
VQSGGAPVGGARVTLFVPSLVSFHETRSASGGAYSFTGIPDGPMQLGVAAPGLAYEEVAVNVSAVPVVRDFDLTPETEPGSWNVIGNTLPEFFDATDIGILLDDGTIFFCHDTVDPIRFDPVTGLKTFPAGSPAAQGCMNATLLDGGQIIMIGGQDGSDPGDFVNGIPWVKAYSPQADGWQWLPWLQHKPGRWYPGLARLAGGALLVMGGGQSPNAARTQTCERFDPVTLQWAYTGSMLNPTEFPPSALLHTGRVLATWWPPQLYDPASGQWTATGGFVQADRGWPGHSDHSLIVLADGRALAVGVRGAGPAAAMGEVYDPAADAWRRVADLNWFREYHAVTLLVPDGRVVTTGGTRIKFQYGPTTADIEAYSPPYLLRGVRPQIQKTSSTQPRRGEAVELDIFPQTQLTGVVLMGAQTTTHWVDGGIPRRIVLSVSQNGSAATFTLPADPNLAPLGRYLLFAMVDDIPSVALVIELRPRSGDVDGDGAVGILDFLAMLAGWGPCPAPPSACPEDVNNDGGVGIGDLLELLGNWTMKEAILPAHSSVFTIGPRGQAP